MHTTAGVIVAAGLSSRMKEFKPLLPYGDSTLILHIVALMKQAGISPILVVTGYRSEDIENHLRHTGVRFFKNERFSETQMFDSVKLGIRELLEEADRIAIMPVDVPSISPSTFSAVMNIDAPMVRTRYLNRPGHPILLSKEAAQTILSYEGEGGLRGAMEHSGMTLIDYEVDDPGVWMDVDTREEYEALIEKNYAQHKGYPIEPVIHVRLKGKEEFFGPGVAKFLTEIEKTGSVQNACLNIDMSYSKGRKMLKGIERELGYSVVHRWAGGSGGGGASLTEEGKRLLYHYELFTKELEAYAAELAQNHFAKGFKL